MVPVCFFNDLEYDRDDERQLSDRSAYCLALQLL
jgi:hypothetical protein